MSCSYVYKNKTYSSDRILRKLLEELPINSQTESTNFLREFLNMTDSEITIVRGLIGGKSLGRLQKDGSILLSELSDIDTARHEAFHRVWRMYLTPDERNFAIREFKNQRSNWKSLIEPYRSLYPNASDSELLEELFADEFNDFVLQPESFKTNQPVLNFFQRIYKWLKQLMGLKPQTINSIYERILNKEFVYPPNFENPYAVDQTIIGGKEFTVEEKQELINSFTQQFIKNLIQSNSDPEDLASIPQAKIKNILDVTRGQITNHIFDQAELSNSERLFDHVDAIESDLTSYLNSNTESEVWEGVKRNLKLLGFSIKEEILTDEEAAALDLDVVSSREFSPTIEVDPFSGISTKIKMLLASMESPEATKNYSLPTPMNAFQEYINIASKLAGVPSSEFLNELVKLDLPYQTSLLNILESNIDFRNKFISQLSLTINQFYVFSYNDNGEAFWFNANQNTAENKLIRNWTSNFVKSYDESWKTRIAAADKSNVSTEGKLAQLGIELDPRVNSRNLVNAIYSAINRKFRNPNFALDTTNPFRSLGIDGYVKDLARLQAEFEDQTNLMIQLGSKKLYPLNLNTHQSILLNGVKYAQSRFTSEMSLADKLNLLKKYAPFAVSDFSVDYSTAQPTITNKWLERILNGDTIDVVIPYIGQTDSGEEVNISAMGEPDLMALHINGSLSGFTMSMKHSDRSTFFAYKMKPLYGKAEAVSAEALFNNLTSDIVKAIQNEVRITKLLRDKNINVQYISKEKPPRGFEELLGDGRFTQLLNGDKINISDINKIKAEVLNQFDQFKSKLDELGSIQGINKNYIAEYGSLDLALVTAYVNETANHIYEAMTFSGDMRSFKDGNDLFKRLAPQSSTGQLVVNDARTNQTVRTELDQDYQVYNPKTKELVNTNASGLLPKDGTFRSITLKENESYRSNLLQPVTVNGKPILSKLTGEPESKIFLIFESNLLKDSEVRSKVSDADLIKKIRLYESKYDGLNENDGQSYMSLPAFKQMQIRLGNWNQGFEIIYKIEMALAQYSSLEEAKDIEIEVRPGIKFKPFEQQDFLNPEINGKKTKLQPLHTLKTQFSGYTIPENLVDDETVNLWFNTVLKTSQHLLTPSAIIGTNLQMMNYTMLTNGIDIIHMGSANKVGGVDPQLAAKNNLSKYPDREYLADVAERGLEFYNTDGEFNESAISENLDLLAYLGDWNYLKDQVKIGNKVKSEIKGSTQSLKIIPSNLISNGVERFEGAKRIISDYVNVIDEIVKSNQESFLKEIGYDNEFTSLDQLQEVILNSTQVENAPENVVNSIKNFFKDIESGLESVPMKNKIENVLYALITNNIVSFDRSGTAMPIAAVTGYEKFGSRKELNSGDLKFYDAKFNEEGDIIEVTPAEIVMPLPSKWIKPMMKWANDKYGITNIIDALAQLNKEISLRPEDFEMKGLRIPNQQLSSNDWYRVKKFNLPTFTNYVIVPSETVVKAGEDFDIDKKNLYWADNIIKQIFNFDKLGSSELEEGYQEYLELNPESSLTFEQYSKQFGLRENASNKLLKLEREILLHPRNMHNLLMPVTDEIFVKGVYNSLVRKNVIKPLGKSLLASVQPQTNVKKSRVFVGGKVMVGPIALSVTNHSVKQADGVSQLNFFYNNQNTKEAESTKLRFAGMQDNYNIGGYTDRKGNVILEAFSQQLSIAVDNVKNPVADDMLMNMQTVGVIDYLLHREVDPETVMDFINQPLVKAYLIAQVSNESLFSKQGKKELHKNALIKKLLEDKGYADEILPEIPEDWVVNDDISSVFDEDQLYHLKYFLELVDQSRAWSDYNQTQTSDTKGIKDRQQYLETLDQRDRVVAADLIPENTRYYADNNGIISPFFTYGRQTYNIYSDMYGIEKSSFGGRLRNLKSQMSEIAKAVDKDRLRQTLENDFLLFFIHNFVLDPADRERLMIGDNSLPHRIAQLKKELPHNLVLKAFLPLLNHTTDPSTGKKLSNLKLFDRELNVMDQKDLLQQIDEIATKYPDVYSDLVKLLFFQSGLNSGPFNYKAVIPVGLESERGNIPDYHFLYQDVISEGIKKINSFRKFDEELFTAFTIAFDLNNTRYLRPKPSSGHLIGKVYNQYSKSNNYFYMNGDKKVVAKEMGSVYTKNYMMEVSLPVEPAPFVQEPQVFNKKGFVPKNAQQSEAIDKIIDFIDNGNPSEWFMLQGKAGTGKTTLIQEVINRVGTYEVVVSALSHKAKSVLDKKLQAAGLDVDAYSVAKLLGIKLNLENGRFEPDPYADVPVQYPRIIIVDEASMIPENILNEIMEQKRQSAKVIFLGDIGQLPPIREGKDNKPSPTFDTPNQYKLTERVRQGEESPILPYADLYWNNSQSEVSVTNPAPDSKRVNQRGAGTELLFETNIADAVDSRVNLFLRAKEEGNSNLIKIVTYTNAKRISLNQRVRNLIFKNPAEYEPGEIIMFNNNYDKGGVKIENADEFAIKDVTPEAFEVGGSKFKGFNLQSVSDKGKLFTFPVLQKSEQTQFKDLVSQLFAEAKLMKGRPGYKEQLAYAWSVANYFAEIDYAYAITSHKAQGSTYETTIVDESDILGVTATTNASKSQSIYTAITRSSKSAVIVNTNNPKQDSRSLDSAINDTLKPC